MNFPKLFSKLSFSLFVIMVVGLLVPQTVFCQTEKLGIVQYTPPKGMTKTLKENVVAFSELDQATGSYCIITVYGATPGTGNAKSDFAREWNNLVVKTFKAKANPKTETSSGDGWTAIGGGSESRVKGFYSWYLKSINDGKEPSKDVIDSNLSRRFSRSYFSKAGQDVDSDVFLNSQEWHQDWADNMNVGKATIKGNTAAVKVKLSITDDDFVLTLKVSLIKEAGVWKIDRVTSQGGRSTR